MFSVAETTNGATIRRPAYQVLRKSSGSLAIFAAIRRALPGCTPGAGPNR